MMAADGTGGFHARRDRAGRFFNLCERSARGFSDVLRWKLGLGPKEALARPLRPLLNGTVPRKPADLDRIHKPDPTGIQLTWIGHASFLLQAAGRNLLIDPVFAEHCAPLPLPSLRRISAPGLRLEELPGIDAVVITHSHYDHLERSSIERFAASARFFAPSGVGQILRSWGAKQVTEASWMETIACGSITLRCLPSRHFSARTLWDRNRTLWCGWRIETPDGRAVHHLGDTGYATFYAELAAQVGPPELALIPIGAYRPRWMMSPVHVDPSEAVQLHRDLGARASLAMHWGAFQLADEPPHEPPVLLAEAAREAGLAEGEFRCAAVGETVVV
jgi:N-acyl-phosphatidylethanolamine-hydrolysing phospholipase D